MTSVPNANSQEDELEAALRLLELGGKMSSFVVPSIFKTHGDFLSEVLYACGNFASTIRKFYHSGVLLKTLRENTVSFLETVTETFAVVFECSAYKFGSKQVKWMVILVLQVFRLSLRLYQLQRRRQALDDRVPPGRPPHCRCSGRACQNRPRLSELLHSCRPLLHALLYACCCGRTSWLPWCAAVATDALALSCLPSPACLSRQQARCRADRLRAAALAYVFRTPCHDRLVMPLARWLAECPVPLLRSLCKLVLTYLLYWRLYYMNMWA